MGRGRRCQLEGRWAAIKAAGLKPAHVDWLPILAIAQAAMGLGVDRVPCRRLGPGRAFDSMIRWFIEIAA